MPSTILNAERISFTIAKSIEYSGSSTKLTLIDNHITPLASDTLGIARVYDIDIALD